MVAMWHPFTVTLELIKLIDEKCSAHTETLSVIRSARIVLLAMTTSRRYCCDVAVLVLWMNSAGSALLRLRKEDW